MSDYVVRSNSLRHDAEPDTWEEVKVLVRELVARGEEPEVFGPNIDYDCDQGGYYMCSRGLTSEQDAELDEIINGEWPLTGSR